MSPAPPWVKGPREGNVALVSSPPWVKGPGISNGPPSPISPGFKPAPQMQPAVSPQPQPLNLNISFPPRSNPPTPTSPVIMQKSGEVPKSLGALLQRSPLPAPTPAVCESTPTMPAPARPPSNMLKSGEAPKSLGALLQQAPLRAPTPSINESTPTVPAPGGNTAKPQLKGPITPAPAGPLAGAKFVLPPLPPPAPPKQASNKTPAQLAKIAALRNSVHPRPNIRSLLSEIEGGLKLNHTVCNDRSKPLVGRCDTYYPDF